MFEATSKKLEIPKWIYYVVGGVLSVSIIFIYSMMKLNYVNKEVDLRTQFEAQQEVNKVVYDEVWKVLRGKAGILSKYSKDFKEAYVGLMNARYEGKNPMMNWIKERNPNLSVDMYKEVSNAISSQRKKFTLCQTRLIDIKRAHDRLLKMPLSGSFLKGKEPLKMQLVTSGKTKKVFNTGEENEEDLINYTN